MKRYWIDTTEAFKVTLYSVDLDEDGEDIPDTEKAIFSARYKEMGITLEDDVDEAWDKTEKAISAALGFIPDYEVN